MKCPRSLGKPYKYVGVTYNSDLCYESQSTVGHYYFEELEFHREHVGTLILGCD
jgi:hypothetical protein